MDTDDLTDELAAFLASQGREDAYRVDKTLKRSAAETTELVYFEGANGSELGPFVRKSIVRSAGIGSAYEALWRAQRAGVRLAHVPRLLECRAAGDRLAVVMEYVEGETAAALVDRVGPSPKLALAVLPSVCEAVAELHGAFDPPLVHRDLKPSNVMLVGDAWQESAAAGAGCPAAVLIDFGIARVYRTGAEADTTHFGTRGYAAPEQFGFGQTDVRSDVYALGAMAAFCCTGVQPVGAIEESSLAAAGTPEPLRRVILRATSFDPAARYASAADLKAALLEADKEGEAGKDHPAAERPASIPAPTDAAGLYAPSMPGARKRPDAASSWDEAKRAAAMLSRAGRGIPRALGVCWNILLLVMFLLVCAACVVIVADPTGSLAGEPTWYIAAVALLVIIPEDALLLALLADRRRWPKRLPLIGAPTFARLLLALVVTAVAGSVLLVILTALKGW